MLSIQLQMCKPPKPNHNDFKWQYKLIKMICHDIYYYCRSLRCLGILSWSRRTARTLASCPSPSNGRQGNIFWSFPPPLAEDSIKLMYRVEKAVVRLSSKPWKNSLGEGGKFNYLVIIYTPVERTFPATNPTTSAGSPRSENRDLETKETKVMAKTFN